MTLRISDEELLHELTARIKSHKESMEAQEKLITQLNSVNEKLLFSELLKTNFLSNMRNEINNPITAILELSRNISSGEISLESMKKLATMIHHEVSNLDFQLRNILFSAEIEAGESPVAISSVNVNSLISRITDSFLQQLGKKGITLDCSSGIPEDLQFYTDAEKLHLIISNLLSNAIQFNRENGRIEISTELEDGHLCISVNDTGIGISEADKNKIYDRFRQLELGSTKTYGGHGLGLSVSKALLEIINGELHIESEPGSGSRFRIRLKQFEPYHDDGAVSFDGNDLIFNEDEGESF